MASPFTFAAVTFLDSSILLFTISFWWASGALFARSDSDFLHAESMTCVINKTMMIAVMALFLILPPDRRSK
jgi:hypothetical protein